MYGKSTGNQREMLEQHLPLLKPFIHRYFMRLTGYVGLFVHFCTLFEKNKTICLRESMKRCIFAFEKREIWLTKEFTCAWLT